MSWPFPNPMETEYDLCCARFEADLGIGYEPQDWGGSEGDPTRIAEFVQYYLSSPDLPDRGKELLIWLIMSSVEKALLAKQLSRDSERLVVHLIRRERAEKYCDIVVQHFLCLADAPPQNPNPLRDWLVRMLATP